MAEATGSRPVGPNQSTVGSTPTSRIPSWQREALCFNLSHTILAEGSTLFQMLRNPGPAVATAKRGPVERW